MKKILILCLLFQLFLPAHAQFGSNSSNNGLYNEFVRTTRHRPALNALRNYVGAKEYDDYSTKEYQGSPFLSNDFVLGDILYDGDTHLVKVALRYDAYKDEFAVKKNLSDPEESAVYLKKAENLSIRISKRTFLVMPYTLETEQELVFFEALYLGQNTQLYKRSVKVFSPEKAAPTPMTPNIPAKFTSDVIFYVKDKSGELRRLPRGNKKIYKFFGDDKDAVKAYVKRNRLDLNSEKDLKTLLTFYNAI